MVFWDFKTDARLWYPYPSAKENCKKNLPLIERRATTTNLVNSK